jgi:putative endonuclease
MAAPPAANRGRDAERRACEHLERQGLRLIARNYRCPRGEIDLVMAERDTIVFVEVRYRRSTAYGTPAETVGPRKQARLRAAAAHYLQRHPDASRRPCRFDIVALTAAQAPEWLPNAFDLGGA